MKPEISEFSYGFALTHELIDALNVKHLGAPTFPTLKQEGAKGGGYDVKIPGIPLFIQFKLSDYLTTKNALDFLHFGGKYYRFKIWASKDSSQHQLLIDLEKTFPLVFYAAPKFHTAETFNRNFANQNIIDNSVFLKPSAIGVIPDSKSHSVSFRGGDPVAIFRSTPIKVNLFDLKRDFNGAIEIQNLINLDEELPSYESFEREMVTAFERSFSNLELERSREFREQRRQNMSAAQFTRYTALSLFGAELFYIK